MILITGHKGAIGSELVQTMEHVGYDRGDSSLDLKIQQCDMVVHLAALTDVTECEKNPEQCYKDNVSLTDKVTSLCRAFNKKLIYTSSCAVYGDSYPDIKPIGKYGESKLWGERCIYNHLDVNDFAILRLTNVFGIPKGVLHILKTAAKNHQPIKCYGDPYRNFIHVQDVCRVISVLTKDFKPGVYNIGNTKATRVKDLMYEYTEVIEQPALPADIQYSHVETDIFKIISPPLLQIEDKVWL